jgi:hypothetical protein
MKNVDVRLPDFWFREPLIYVKPCRFLPCPGRNKGQAISCLFLDGQLTKDPGIGWWRNTNG